jgi:hypothetical protein
MRGVPRARRAISPRLRIAVDAEDARRAPHDAGQFLRRVELQTLHDAEAVAQRRGEQAGAGGGADQGERRQVELDRTRGRALADHDVDLVVLHRRIEHFLHHRRRRWISSTNNTSCGCRLVSSAARSPARSITGPDVWRRFTPNSFAITCDSVVLPRPGGPKIST